MLHSHSSRRLATLITSAFLALLIALPAWAEMTEQFHRTVPLSADGRVSLNNINGDVEITGWSRNEVQIDAVKTAPTSSGSTICAIEVNAAATRSRSSTKYPDDRNNNNPGSVHYTLHVPQNADIDKVDLVNGTLDREEDFRGDHRQSGQRQAARLRSGGHRRSGDGEWTIDANYTSLNNVRRDQAESVNGTLNLLLPQSPNADVSASAVNGSISTDFPLTVKGHFVGKSMSGTLGSGGVEIELNNVNGSIHIGPGRGSL